MKTIILAAILFSSAASAWGPYGPYGPGFGGYGMGWGGYGMGYGYIPFIPGPSFNYNTVIQQSPPIVINNNDPNYAQPPQQYNQSNCYQECSSQRR